VSAPLVIDTSVAYKWFADTDEPGVEAAVALLPAQLAGAIELHAPATLPVELANALRYSGHAPEVVLNLIEGLDLVRIELAASTARRLNAASALAYRHGMSVYDALFLALAEELGCPLVTADRRAFGSIDTSVEVRLL
jgi:predicted nucleic acid-binding protein